MPSELIQDKIKELKVEQKFFLTNDELNEKFIENLKDKDTKELYEYRTKL